VIDPRSSATPAVLAEQQRLGREIYQQTMLSRKAVSEIGSVKKQLEGIKQPNQAKSAFLASLNGITRGEGSLPGLDSANTGLLAALRVVESGNRETPAQAIELYRQAKEAFEQRAAEWNKLKTHELPKLNLELEKAGTPPISMSAIEEEIDDLMTR
jgi:hypothetical protein